MPFTARRKNERQRVAVPARFWRDGGFVDARTRDISLGGAFIETDAPMPLGVECLIELRLPTLTAAVQVTATVRWSNREGMGVQWGVLRVQHAWAINQLFAP